MPLYAYECKDCGVRFERRQSFDDPAITVCPECEGTVHRLIQPAGVIFKGSGFYVTDNKSSSHSSTSSVKNDKSASEKSTGEASKKSDSKASESKSEKSASGAKSDA